MIHFNPLEPEEFDNYMSPEEIQKYNKDIDTRILVFSLFIIVAIYVNIRANSVYYQGQ